MKTRTKELERIYREIKRLNEQIAYYQALRNNNEIEALREGGFKDWQEFNADYIAWEL